MGRGGRRGARKGKRREHGPRAWRRRWPARRRGRLPVEHERERSQAISSREDTSWFHGRGGSIRRARHCAPKAKFRAVCGSAKARSPARCPSLRRQEWRSSSFLFLLLAKGKARLGAFPAALQVGVLLVNPPHRDCQRSRVDDDRRRMMPRPQKIDEQRHGRGGRDGAQRNIAPIEYAKKE